MRTFTVVLTILTLIPFSAPTTQASLRSEKPFGAHLGFNGGVSPGLLGVGLNYQFHKVVRLNFGISGANDFTTNTPARIYNATLAPILITTLSFISYIMTLGLIPFSDHRSFWDLKAPMETPKFFLAFGPQVQIFYPQEALNPFISLGFASYTSDGSYGLENRGSHLFYGAGVDWSLPSGFFVDVGWNFSPKLSEELKHAFYLTTGYTFL